MEWRFRSNHPFAGISTNSDAGFVIEYLNTRESMNMNGDAAFSQSANDGVVGLELGAFHTYRYESLDGFTFRISVNGQVFIETTENQANSRHLVEMRGANDRVGDFVNGKINEWDFVRYGTIGFGEQIIATEPPAGTFDVRQRGGLDRFTVTFDAPNYVYIEDITVTVTGGAVPVVTKTRRQENGEPDTVEIVLDRGLLLGETTTFTITDGVATHIIAYKPDFDDDGDGVFNSEDNCPNHPNPDQADCDNDGRGNVCTLAECTGDPACVDCDGNGVPDGCDRDGDGDGTINACDGCPIDPSKVSPGVCGCGLSDDDTDLDGVLDCNDQCPDEDDLRDLNNNGLPDCVEGLVPTLSTWGVFALTLLLMIGGKILFDRRRVRNGGTS